MRAEEAVCMARSDCAATVWRDSQNAVRKAAAAKAVEDAVAMKVAHEVAALQVKKAEDAAAEDIKDIKPYVQTLSLIHI